MTLPEDRELGGIVRAARVTRGLRQDELGRLCGYSASQISRWETGRVPLRDTHVLRTLALALGIPPGLLGLRDDGGTGGGTGGGATDGAADSPVSGARWSEAIPPTVGRTRPPTPQEDDVRRRAFLQTAAAAAAGAVVGGSASSAAVDPAQLLSRELGQVLVGSVTPAPGAPPAAAALDRALAVAEADFAACRYVPLAGELPGLIIAGEALTTAREQPAGYRALARIYNLTSHTLGKLEISGLNWVAADRGFHAAQHGGDPLTLAESQRLVATVARRAGHHGRAQDLTMAAVDDLLALGSADPQVLGATARLMCSAGYAAAQAGDRERTRDLYDRAALSVRSIPDELPVREAVAANVLGHQVSAWCVLGDAGTALACAQRIPLGSVPTVERRARLLVDVAQAWAQWGKPDRALQAVLAAEREAPGEVRTRGAVRRLVTDLARHPGPGSLSALPALAQRVHVAI